MELYRQIVERDAASGGVVLGTVVDAAGSTPQKPGCQALLDARGTFAGTLGGGLLEAEAIEAMRGALAEGRARMFERRLDDAYSRAAGPICGGVMRIFINPAVTASRGAIEDALRLLESRRRALLITRLDTGAIKCVELGNGSAMPALAPDAPSPERLIASETPELVRAADGTELFAEPIAPAPRRLVVGGGHVGRAVVELAAQVGFDITLFDDRAEFAEPSRYPENVATAHGNLRELVAAYPKDRDTYIVLVSKGHRPDAEALEACIHDELAYLGMIGSRRKVRLLRDDFIARGLATEGEFDRVVAPIGYEIGAITVPEIAVSIVAQLVAARRSPASVREIAVKAR